MEENQKELDLLAAYTVEFLKAKTIAEKGLTQIRYANKIKELSASPPPMPDEAKEHKCKYCGVMTTQPDEECYKKPSISDDVIEDIIKKWSVTLHHAHSSLTIGMQDIPALIGFNAVSAFKEFRSQCDGLIKQKAVEFADFILNGGWYEADSKPYHWCRMEEFIMVYKTTEELYEIFNQQER